MLGNVDLIHWVLMAAIVAAGGFMRGFAGFGPTLVMVPFLSLIVPPSEAVLIALSTDVLVTIVIVPKAARIAEWEPIIPLVLGGFIATPIGVWILMVTSPEIMRMMISILIILFAFLLLSGWTYRGKKNTLISLLIGMFAGATNSATAIGGPPIAVYFMAKGMSPITFRASLNVVSFIMEGVSAIAIYFAGSFDIKNILSILILFPFMLIFAWLGSLMFRVVENKFFNKVMLYFLIFFGGYTLILTL